IIDAIERLTRYCFKKKNFEFIEKLGAKDFFDELSKLSAFKAAVDDMYAEINKDKHPVIDEVAAPKPYAVLILDIVLKDLLKYYDMAKAENAAGIIPDRTPEQAKKFVDSTTNAHKYDAIKEFNNEIIPRAKFEIREAYDTAAADLRKQPGDLAKINNTLNSVVKDIGPAKEKVDAAAKKTHDLPKAGAAASPPTVPLSQNSRAFPYGSTTASKNLDAAKKPTTLATSARYGGAFTKKQ
ncbi:MAG: hypothetical protein NTU49_00295, partial [Gammaproteobacteria bacterium]|nr:hypothetical protein [Gammaproteobacteria bacterium]